MKRIANVILCMIVCLACLFPLVACSVDDAITDTLVVYNWADYIYDYKEDFQKYYSEMTGGRKIDITYVTFDTNETMLTKIMKGDSNVDVICPSEYAIQKLLESDMLVKMNYQNQEKYLEGLTVGSNYVHNYGNVDQNVIEKVGEAFSEVSVGNRTENMLDYFVPYMYGTLGILYNKYTFMDLGIYDKDVMNNANWGILFNDNGSGQLLSEGLTGSILMKDSIRDSYAATVFYLLESGRLDGKKYQDKSSPYYDFLYTDMPVSALINAVDDQLLELCKEALTNQKKQLFGYEVDFGKDDLLKGNAAVDLAWSGDALYAVEESWNDDLGEDGDYELAYYVPHSTGNIWFDGWVIPKTYNPDHELAIKLFINFLNSPYAAAQNMMEIGYTSAVSPDVVRNDPAARAVLMENYLVYDPDHEYWDSVNEKGKPLTEDTADYASWEEFEAYFFDNADLSEIDDSNWRYPFESAKNATTNRGIETLGVMRDFGPNNKAVVTMWNYARSAGVSVWGVLGVTVGALALAAAIIALFVFAKGRLQSKVVIKKARDD